MRKMKILVVDDEEDVCGLIADAFIQHGHEADMAHNGADALAMVQNTRYDGMVLDLVMPGISGEAVMAQRELFPDTAVIVLTAHGSEDAAIQAIRARVNDYIKKPFNLKELVAIMNHYIGEYGVGDFRIHMPTGTVFCRDQEVRKMARSGGLFEIFEMFVRNPGKSFDYLELVKMLFKAYPRHADQRPDLARQLKADNVELSVATDYLKPQMSRLRSILREAAGYEVIMSRANIGFGWSYKAMHPER